MAVFLCASSSHSSWRCQLAEPCAGAVWGCGMWPRGRAWHPSGVPQRQQLCSPASCRGGQPWERGLPLPAVLCCPLGHHCVTPGAEGMCDVQGCAKEGSVLSYPEEGVVVMGKELQKFSLLLAELFH